ncbi:YbjQ family protein [Candidatus Epulonipiscium viviparus]|uniref:YbjQ family protein n=1 Tax=Candidatus Epulonipiscium viviparus TaxID=420336 RepID=UPI00273808E7|nr:YbjQ family protein [Candidatus Epulopiscium viviparus]
MLLTSTDFIDDKELEILGLVTGSTVQAKHVGQDIAAGFKNMVGGELKSYTEMIEDARKKAVDRMIYNAKVKNADAVVNVRFNSSTIVQGAAEILVCGTAVKFKEIE